MSFRSLPGRLVPPLFPTLLLLVALAAPARAAEDPAGLLPPESCAPGWKQEGKTLLYDKETLSDRIDGEAELYFPYGFQAMAAGRYVGGKNPDAGIDVEIYRMGSLLDAFGMYANYRQKEGRTLSVGAESNLAGTQLYLYQGRIFVHIQLTGSENAGGAPLADCGRAVAARLPGKAERPSELSVLSRPEVVQGSERYLPQSLLGYDFLGGGLMADGVVEGGDLQLFFLLGNSSASAATVLERFRSQLAQAKVEPVGAAQLLEGVDPLYGPVSVFRKGGCVAGALKYSGKKGIGGFLESLCK